MAAFKYLALVFLAKAVKVPSWDGQFNDSIRCNGTEQQLFHLQQRLEFGLVFQRSTSMYIIAENWRLVNAFS
jgi:hypothetical protein